MHMPYYEQVCNDLQCDITGRFIDLASFQEKKNQCWQSEDTRREIKWLYFLRLDTIMKLGSAEESAAAQTTLGKTKYCSLIGKEDKSQNQNWNATNDTKSLSLIMEN